MLASTAIAFRMAPKATLEATRQGRQHTVLRSLGLGLITGAADDDCSAIGTYAQAGAQFGYHTLWTVPLTLPMMVAVVYLSGKLGQVTGQGLFSVLRTHSARWLLYTVLVGVIVGTSSKRAPISEVWQPRSASSSMFPNG